MPLLKRLRVLAAQIESTVGTAETLDAADGAFHVYDVEIQANIDVPQRANTAQFGTLVAPQGARMGTVTFKLNPYGDGAGGVPTWASTFLPACGLVNTAGTFNPVSEAAGGSGGVKTVTIGVFENGLYKELYGATGTFSLTSEVGEMAEITFTFTGCWSDPSDAAMPSPTYPTELPYRAAGASNPFSWGSFTGCIGNYSFDVGNNNIMRRCMTAGNETGYISGLITDRNPSFNFSPESTLVATHDIFGDWKDSIERSCSFSLEDADGSMTINAVKSQITNIQEGDREGIQIDNVDARVNEDDFNIVFA